MVAVFVCQYVAIDEYLLENPSPEICWHLWLSFGLKNGTDNRKKNLSKGHELEFKKKISWGIYWRNIFPKFFLFSET